MKCYHLKLPNMAMQVFPFDNILLLPAAKPLTQVFHITQPKQSAKHAEHSIVDVR